MNLNRIGVVGVILALIGLFLPWWEISLSVWEATNNVMVKTSASISVFPYQISSKSFPAPQTIAINVIPFVLCVMPFVVVGAELGIAGCAAGDDEEKEKILLILAGSSTLLSTIMFAFMLQVELLASPPASYFFFGYPGRVPPYSLVPIPKVGIFSNGTSTFEEVSINYSSYLSIGFWLTVIAAVVMLIASRRHA